MTSKIKNNSLRYLTRAALGGACLLSARKGDKDSLSTERERSEAERRDANGILDRRWYIQLPPKR
jgi:hypothetical protein